MHSLLILVEMLSRKCDDQDVSTTCLTGVNWSASSFLPPPFICRVPLSVSFITTVG
eukprot:m.68403 g.68403  ORF g.68403 m.68403 type:complete len:56 (-) comp13682_c0_seq2:1508-1675(-)